MACSYKRFKLSDEKEFSSLFFPEKDDMLKLLKHFEDKTGEVLRVRILTDACFDKSAPVGF